MSLLHSLQVQDRTTRYLQYNGITCACGSEQICKEYLETAFHEDKSNTLRVKSAGSAFGRNCQELREDQAEANKNLFKW